MQGSTKDGNAEAAPVSAVASPSGAARACFLRFERETMNDNYNRAIMRRLRALQPVAGFTLIELLVVLAIVATLLTIAVPRYFRSIDHAKEVALKQSLAVMRDAIDKFHGDRGVYPESLEAMVEKRYLRAVPMDPLTESVTTWQVVAPAEPNTGKVYNVRSGAQGESSDGARFEDW
jgi:general secretion pathway protein G